MKIVVNQSHGVFKLSREALKLLDLREYVFGLEDWRTDPILISVIEDIGSEKASGKYARLKVIEIPDDVDWEISDYDNVEHVVEKHRSWS